MTNEKDIFRALRESNCGGKAIFESIEDTNNENYYGNDTVTDDGYELVESCATKMCLNCGAVLNINDVDEEVCPYCGNTELEEAFVTAVRQGKKVKIKKRIGPKKHLSSAQKMALAKARKKAHTGSANRMRNKSMKIAKRMK